MEREKIIIFIDGANLYHRIKNMFANEKTDYFNFNKFIKYLTGDRELIAIYYYNVALDINHNPKSYAAQQKFFYKLKKIKNLKLIVCRMQKVIIGGKEVYQAKEDDIHLASDMIELGVDDTYDTAILVSGDGDFVPAIKVVQRRGKKVENVGFEKEFSYYLKKVCDRFRKLSKDTVSKFFGD